jgi:two-component system CheB/CheR fusion protein
MPRAAIDTHMVDLVLPVVEMPQKFLELWRNAKNITLPSANDPQLQTITWVPERDAEVAEQRLHDILSQLRAGTGDFKHYKRATVLRRIERRMQVTAQPDLGAYYHYLRHTPEETTALLGDMLIGVTNFFRDREAFEALERDVVPQLVSAAGSAPQKKKFGFGQLVVPRERKPTVWRCCSTISYNWTGVRPPFNYLPPTSMSGPSA